MNKISKKRIELAKKNFKRFNNSNVIASYITGSVAKGIADENSDIDTIINYKKPFAKKQFDKIVSEAKKTGGDLYHGTPEDGFAVYYYIDGIKCDFGFGDYRDTEKMINEMTQKPEADEMKHLQISGFIDSIVIKGGGWVNKWRKKVSDYPPTLAVMTVENYLKFHPEWVLQKMGIERNDILFLNESMTESIGNIFGILCGLNKKYLPGKLKGMDYYLGKMKIKPENIIERYRMLFKSGHDIAVRELYKLIRETILLVEKYMPEVSTRRTKKTIEMKLRK